MSDFHFCPLSSGSSGNAHYAAGGGSRVLIDAGLSGKSIEAALHSVGVNPENLDGILVTHEHIDHVRGVGVLARRFGTPVYANAATWDAMCGLIGSVPKEQRRVFVTGREFSVGDIEVSPFSISHDAAEPVGFCLQSAGKKVALVTDLGHTTPEILERVADADILLIESNHDIDMLKRGGYPPETKKRILSNHGHLSNEACAQALVTLASRGLRRALLGHLSHDNNLPELAMKANVGALSRAGAAVGTDVFVDLTWRDRVAGYYVVR